MDAAYTLDHWEEKALPGFLASTVDTVRSVRKLHQVVRQGAMIVTEHDPDAWPLKSASYYVDRPSVSFVAVPADVGVKVAAEPSRNRRG